MSEESKDTATAVVADGSDVEFEVQPDPAEVQAREMGWKPKEEWDGDDTGWMPAGDFLARNVRLKDRADGIAKADIARLTAKVESLTGTLDQFRDHHSKVEQRAYARAVNDLKAKQREAVADGDQDAFDAAAKEIDGIETDAKEAAKKPAATNGGTNPDSDPDFTGWLAENAWYDPKSDDFDPELSAFAEQIAPTTQRTGLTGRAYYERIGQEVRKKHPDSFGNKRRKAAPAVEGAGGATPPPGKNRYADLPSEAKSACDKFVKEGLLTKEQYVQEYFTE